MSTADLRTGNRRAPLSQRGDDFYGTPAVAVEALMRAERLPHRIWEPCCGENAIVAVLRKAGHFVVASDLVDYGRGEDYGADFLMTLASPSGTGAIVTNPPFKLAEQFVAHALTLCPRVIMLLRLAFLESDRRTDILERSGLARVHVFRKRLPMMHRDGWFGPQIHNSGMAFAWFVWDRSHTGPTELHRISWERP